MSTLLFSLDISDQAGALGYHRLSSNGQAVARILEKRRRAWPDMDRHLDPRDAGEDRRPYANCTVFIQDSNTTEIQVAFKWPILSKATTSAIGLMACWSAPSSPRPYFEFGGKAHKTHDFGGVLTAPLSVSKSGYISVFTRNPSAAGWTHS